MADLYLASAIHARQPLTGRADAARQAEGAPAEDIPCPADILLDALKLRSNANGASVLGSAGKVAGVFTAAAGEDSFEVAYASSGVIDRLAPSFSRGIVGAGLNALVIGTGAKQAGDRHRSFVTGVDQTLRSGSLDFGAVYKLTSLTQQVAVFWRTMGNATFKSGMWLLKHAGRIGPLQAPAAGVSLAIARAATTPAGRALGFLNKWIPLLNAAWVMLAAKTAWEINHDAKSSTTTRAVSIVGVAVSVAAVWAGITMSGFAFMAVTAASIGCDLLLAEARHRDKALGDTNALAKRWATHPWEAAGASVRWGGRVSKVIAGRWKRVVDRLRGEKTITIKKPTPPDERPAQPPAVKPVAVNPRRKLTIG